MASNEDALPAELARKLAWIYEATSLEIWRGGGPVELEGGGFGGGFGGGGHML